MDSENKLNIFKNKKVLAGLVVCLIIIPVFIGAVAFLQQRGQNDPQVLAANQVNDLLAEVGKLIDLPDETPTVATVSDVSKLTNQEFFAKAQNGDKVIIFPNAQKAILYRPGTKKIVEVAFYSPPEATPGVSEGASAPTPTTSISLRDLVNPTDRPSPAVSPLPSGSSISPTISPTPSQ